MNVFHICVLQTILIVKITQVLGDDSSVKPDCNYGADKVKLTYFGDAKAVMAVTKSGLSCLFKEDKAAASFTMVLPYKMKLGSGHLCKMDKKQDMKVYSITVKARMEHKDFTSINDEAFFIQCNFEPSTSDVGGAAEMAESVKQPIIVNQNVATLSSSKIVMSFIRVDNKEFPESIEMGRTMKLKVVMTAAPGDVGFKPTTCKAVSSDGKATRMLLVDGCGVGLPWGNKAGFTVKGLTGYSPSFEMFRVKRNQDVVFTCDFTICKKKCDGSSCNKSRRRKREAEVQGNETLPNSLGDAHNGMLNLGTSTKDFEPFIDNNDIANPNTRLRVGSDEDQHEDNSVMAKIPPNLRLVGKNAAQLIVDDEILDNDISPEVNIKVSEIPPNIIRDLMVAHGEPLHGGADDTKFKTLNTNTFLYPTGDNLNEKDDIISNHVDITGNKIMKLEGKLIGTSNDMLSPDVYKVWEEQKIIDSEKQSLNSLPDNGSLKCNYLGLCIVMVVIVILLLISILGRKYSFLGKNNERFV